MDAVIAGEEGESREGAAASIPLPAAFSSALGRPFNPWASQPA